MALPDGGLGGRAAEGWLGLVVIRINAKRPTLMREPRMGVGSHEVTLLQVSTATSSRNRSQPNAFAVVEAGKGGFDADSEVWDGRRFVTGTQD